MADTSQMDDRHFGKIFWFIIYCVTNVFAYAFLVSFLHVPKENERLVDIILGAFIGSVLTACISYLVGGNPDKKKDTPTPSTQESITVTKTATDNTDKPIAP